ncbi:2018_t:CDS:2 [Gigaspora margarita]|uniref:2018_t:CDS:1 n=1 Tax=Gigaspora margarita TaxID=4874 RepID=A0ABN7UUZ5_GIGMA|nr:2018_t:CDS:2 [Gigaspora margarita]
MFNKQIRNLSFPHFGQWLLYYYKAWFGFEAKNILSELQQYQERLYPFERGRKAILKLEHSDEDYSDDELIEHSFEDGHPAIASKAKWKII